MGNLVHLRLGEKLTREIDAIVRHETYENRSAFIKEALRRVIDEYRKRRIIESLTKRRGEGRRLGIKELSDEEYERIRERLGNQLFMKHGLG